MPLSKEQKYTAEEFFKLVPETNESYELINGEIVAQAAPSILHQTISGEVSFALRDHIKKKKGGCKVFEAPTDVKLSEDTVVQPDILVICDSSKIDEKHINGAPDLIIEIASGNSYLDYSYKLDLYRNSGVREYWIIDPKSERTVVYLFGDRAEVNIYTFDKPIPVGIYGGEISIAVAELM